MDKLLRGYGLPCYQKQGNEAEGNGREIDFLFTPSGNVDLMKREGR